MNFRIIYTRKYFIWPCLVKPFSNYVRHDCGVKMLNFFKLFFFPEKGQWTELEWHRIHVIAAVMPNRHGILTESPPSGPPLPEDLTRTWNKLVSHLLGHKQKHNKKKSCEERPRSPSLTLQYCNNCHYYSCVSIRRAQNLGGLSPRSGQLFSLQCSPPPHYQPMGAPYFGTGPRLFCLAVVVLFFFNHYRTWTNLKREAFTESQDGVKVHMEPLDSVLDFGGLILTEVICESPVSWPSDTTAVCWDRKHGISHTFIPWH